MRLALPRRRSRSPRRPELAAVLAAVLCAGCAGGWLGAVFETGLGPPTVLVGVDTNLLAQPFDVAVGGDGTVYVLDRQDRRVVAVGPDGKPRRTIGRAGQGPGEFMRPMGLGIVGGNLRVYDFGRGNVQVLDAEGRYVSDYPVDVTGLAPYYTFGPRGWLAYFSSRVPRRGALVAVLGDTGVEMALIGEPISEDSLIGEDFIEEILDRRLPEFMRNAALPVIDSDQQIWVFLQTEAVLRRYRLDGQLTAAADVPVPEMAAIEEAFFEWYAEIGAAEAGASDLIRFFNYVEDGEAFAGGIWLLWNTPRDQEGLITVHDESGAIIGRLTFASEAEDPFAFGSRRRFALDVARRRVYLVDAAESVLKALEIPEQVFNRFSPTRN